MLSIRGMTKSAFDVGFACGPGTLSGAALVGFPPNDSLLTG